MREIFNPMGKMFCQLDRVNAWLSGKNVGPILVEINPINKCNHLSKQTLFEFLKDFKDLDGIAVNWTGGVEPTIYPFIKECIYKASELGLEQGMFTNGQCLNGGLGDLVIRKLRWVRVSLNSSTHHGVDTFNKIVNNIKSIIHIRKNMGFDSVLDNGEKRFTIGICMSINLDNYKELFNLCRSAKEWGVDYFQLRPILATPGNLQMGYEFWKHNITPEIEKCYELQDKFFDVMYTRYKFEELEVPEERVYDKCYCGQFVPVVDANGDVVNCMYFLKNPDFILGNLYQKSFKDIWKSGWQKKIEKLDLSGCQVCCKNNEINKFLYVVKHKPFIHRNFI